MFFTFAVEQYGMHRPTQSTNNSFVFPIFKLHHIATEKYQRIMHHYCANTTHINHTTVSLPVPASKCLEQLAMFCKELEFLPILSY